MPEILTLKNIGLKGLASDPAPWSLEPDFITYGRNFRIFAGSIMTDNGNALWDTAPAAYFPGHIFRVGSISGNFWIIPGRNAVYVFDGTTFTDVSSVAGYAGLGTDDELRWTSLLLGQIPIINNPQAAPEYWSPQMAGQILQPLQFDPGNTWAALGYSMRVMRSHKSFLFALNLTESGVEFPDTYRWSHPADINGLPVTWDETDDAFLAGKAALGGDGGNIIDGFSLRDAFCIYSEDSIDILDSTNDEFVWRRRDLSSTIGLLSKDSIVEVKGTHFLMTYGDIVKNDGNAITSIAHNRIRKEYAQRIDPDNYINAYAIRNDNEKEVWFCIPEVGEMYANIAYIYNWKDDSWAVKDIPADIGHAATGTYADPAVTWDSLGASETWDIYNGIWNSAFTSPINDTIVGVNPLTEELTFLDPIIASETDLNFFIERTNFPLLGQNQITTITRIYPHINGETPVIIKFGSQDYNDAPIRWKPEVTFDPSTQRKVDIRTTGELHCWNISSIGKNNLSISGMTIEYVKAGLR
jgi:hypothetical protein